MKLSLYLSINRGNSSNQRVNIHTINLDVMSKTAVSTILGILNITNKQPKSAQPQESGHDNIKALQECLACFPSYAVYFCLLVSPLSIVSR